MFPFFLIRLLMMIVLIVMLTGAILIIMHYYFKLKRPIPVQADPTQVKSVLLPLKLQAYERIILFLERISPPGLIQRVSRPEMNPVQLEAALTRTIRDEFEYNLSQQLYVSSKSWEMVKNAKEETIRLIHIAAGKVPEGASSQELIKSILDQLVADEKHPVDHAIEAIKQEVRELG